MKDFSDSPTGGYPMPDIASSQATAIGGRLNWVGMAGLDIPVRFDEVEMDTTMAPTTVAAKGEAYVSLMREGAKGIHMSRLFLTIEENLTGMSFTPKTLKRILEGFLETHKDLSDAAFFALRLDWPLRRKALKSDNWGWRQYPVEIKGVLSQGELKVFTEVEVLYSSTCPCSAALARQLIQGQFKKDFASNGSKVNVEDVVQWLGSEEGIVATPHSQRSAALVKVELDPQAENFKIVEVLNALEGSLKTIVQTAVKREDEQEFARLNGQNLMFCEDAARRVSKTLSELSYVKDFFARCTHYESLHAHDAVSVVTKGVPGGFQA